MFQKFDFTATSKKERLIKASLIGLIAAILLGFLFSFVTYHLNMRFQFSIFYALLGYAIGIIVQKIGRGITKEFAYLAAVLTIISLLTADITTILLPFGFKYFSFSMISFVLRHQYLETIFNLFRGIDVWNNGMFLIFRVVAVVMAINYSRPTVNR